MSASGLTPEQIVLQSAMCHPDWNEDTHIHYLIEEEGVDADRAVQAVERFFRPTVLRRRRLQ